MENVANVGMLPVPMLPMANASTPRRVLPPALRATPSRRGQNGERFAPPGGGHADAICFRYGESRSFGGLEMSGDSKPPKLPAAKAMSPPRARRNPEAKTSALRVIGLRAERYIEKPAPIPGPLPANARSCVCGLRVRPRLWVAPFHADRMSTLRHAEAGVPQCTHAGSAENAEPNRRPVCRYRSHAKFAEYAELWCQLCGLCVLWVGFTVLEVI